MFCIKECYHSRHTSNIYRPIATGLLFIFISVRRVYYGNNTFITAIGHFYFALQTLVLLSKYACGLAPTITPLAPTITPSKPADDSLSGGAIFAIV